ncbi:MAG: hypothetical protein P8Y97_19695, partial [Candidatus Lokiarchaeota archaeon]
FFLGYGLLFISSSSKNNLLLASLGYAHVCNVWVFLLLVILSKFDSKTIQNYDEDNSILIRLLNHRIWFIFVNMAVLFTVEMVISSIIQILVPVQDRIIFTPKGIDLVLLVLIFIGTILINWIGSWFVINVFFRLQTIEEKKEKLIIPKSKNKIFLIGIFVFGIYSVFSNFYISDNPDKYRFPLILDLSILILLLIIFWYFGYFLLKKKQFKLGYST